MTQPVLIIILHQEFHLKVFSRETEKKYTALKNILSTLESAAVAYSGGVDSTLLLYTASEIAGLKLMAYTIKSALVPEHEIASAVDFVNKYSIPHQIIFIDLFSFTNITTNSPERCYYCKKNIFKTIIDTAASAGIKSILEGSHIEDLDDYRPGLKALRELGVKSPLRDAGFSKNNIHDLSSYLNLTSAGKESYSCLATRIPYGTPLTKQLLQRVELAERILSSFGFRNVRARIHGEILRIEIDEKMISEITASPVREQLYNTLHKAGFIYITVDLQGYRSGSMNLVLKEQL